MFAAAAVFFLALSVLAFAYRLRLGLYRRYPYEQFVFVGAGFLFGLLAALENPGAVTLALLAVELAAVGLVVRYLAIGARFPSDEGVVRPGERFPEFALPDSEGRIFDSRSILGSSATLYVSYRGHL
jgi:hypothetical protein